MEYQTKLKTKSGVEVNDDARRTCSPNSQINFKTMMLKPSVSDDNDAYILVKWNINITGAGTDWAAKNAG